MERKNAQITISTIVSLGMLGVLGCLGGQGSTDGGSGADGNFRDDVFVSDDISTGTVELEVQNSSLGIGETSPFTVRVLNARRQPVQQINVVCDSEEGIAIIEPQRGYELTSDSGVVSGVIGCESPGNFQMVCRLSVGANKRKFAGVQCSGEVPSGFNGFPGSAGGGLGGGSQTDGNEGGVRITSISFKDGANQDTSTPSIDIVFDSTDCDPDTDGIQPEFFTDTQAVITVRNDGTQAVIFNSLQYVFKGFRVDEGENDDGDTVYIPQDFPSRQIGITYESESVTEVGADSTFSVPVFKAYGGGKWVGDPEVLGTGAPIENDGIRTIIFTLRGETVLGEPVEITGRTSAAFGNYNGCQ